jgi:hypothetical protein
MKAAFKNTLYIQIFTRMILLDVEIYVLHSAYSSDSDFWEALTQSSSVGVKGRFFSVLGPVPTPASNGSVY